MTANNKKYVPLVLADRLRKLGCAVVVFTPEELGDADARTVEASMVGAGNDAIDLLNNMDQPETFMVDNADLEAGMVLALPFGKTEKIIAVRVGTKYVTLGFLNLPTTRVDIHGTTQIMNPAYRKA